MQHDVAPSSGSQGIARPRRRVRQILLELRFVYSALRRTARSRTILLPVGLMWRISAILYVLIQHAERTNGDVDMLRQARSIHATLVQMQSTHPRTIRNRPINITPGT